MCTLTMQRSALSAEAESNRPEDLEKKPVDKVLPTLAVQPDKGLTCAEAVKRLAKYGPNAIIEKEISLTRKILQHFTRPIAYMIEAAAIVSAIIGHWDDFIIITGLLLSNAALEFWQDHNASNALVAPKKALALEATAVRNGKWQAIQAALLVPGDVVKVRLGVIVPADLRFVAAHGTAALILSAPGLSVINNAIDEARRIFGRITSYTIYWVNQPLRPQAA